MALLGKTFNATEIAPRENREFTAIPPGKYMLHIVNSDMRKIKPKIDQGQDPNGDYGQYLMLDMEVIQGEYERRRLFVNLNLDHPNPQTVQIAEQEFGEICLACGRPNIQDSVELHDIPFMADIIVIPDWRNKNPRPGQEPFPPVNKIRAYHKLEGAAPVRQAASAFAAGSPPNGSQGGAGGVAVTSGGGVGSFMPAARTPSAGVSGLPWGKK